MYKQLKQTERYEIQILYEKWYSIREIGNVLWRSASTISREMRRNKVNEMYNGQKAEIKKYMRRRWCKIEMKKIRMNSELEWYIREKIKEWRSPEQIAWRRNKENDKWISYVRIYEYIESCRWSDLRIYISRKWRKRKKWERWSIIWRVFIDERPKEIWDKLENGHYECDTVIWKRWWDKEILLVLLEKKTRYMVVSKIKDKSAKWTNEKLWEWISDLWVKSITFDNWHEFWWHYKLWIPTYFCHPYSSWEKGQVEYGNRLIRRWLPKKTNFSNVNDEYIQYIIRKINSTPRKCLWWNTPEEIFNSSRSVALEI